MPKTFFVRTFGCQMNEHDSEQIAANFASEGYVRVGDPEHADVVVLNTCCIRQNADNKLYGHLGHLKSLRDRNPTLQIAVGGCLAQKDREHIVERAPFVDAVFGTHNVARAVELLDKARAESRSIVEILDAAPEDVDVFPTAQHVREELPYAAWVTIQVGCDNSCAFCIVPSVRGKEQSRPFGALVEEVEELARTGTVEVTLLGQNVNSYGRDLTTKARRTNEPNSYLTGVRWQESTRPSARPLFADLLRVIGSVTGIRRVRFTSPHPKDLRPETIAAMAQTSAVCEQLHLPLQSGSDTILSAMRRGYTATRYLERLAAARRAISDLAVTTDVIVGFPGETDADFDETLAVVAEAGYDGAFTFIYSPRPGTRAAEMTDRFVSPEVIAQRFARLKDVVDRSALRHNEDRIGRLEEVILEGRSRKDEAVLAGRTRQGKLVHFAAHRQTIPVGSFAIVRIESAGAHHLGGALLEVTEQPAPLARRREIRIPITAS